MRCKKCRQEGAPLHEVVTRLAEVPSVAVLSSCAGFMYEGHYNIPDRPFILFSISSFRDLERLFKDVFTKLSVPTCLSYNGAQQFIFEIDLPANWPNHTELVAGIWTEITRRMKEFKA